MVHSNKNLKAISIRAICLTILDYLGGLSTGLGTVKENWVNMFQTTYLFSKSFHNWSHISASEFIHSLYILYICIFSTSAPLVCVIAFYSTL